MKGHRKQAKRKKKTRAKLAATTSISSASSQELWAGFFELARMNTIYEMDSSAIELRDKETARFFTNIADRIKREMPKAQFRTQYLDEIPLIMEILAKFESIHVLGLNDVERRTIVDKMLTEHEISQSEIPEKSLTILYGDKSYIEGELFKISDKYQGTKEVAYFQTEHFLGATNRSDIIKRMKFLKNHNDLLRSHPSWKHIVDDRETAKRMLQGLFNLLEEDADFLAQQLIKMSPYFANESN